MSLSANATSWERRLLELAYEGSQSPPTEPCVDATAELLVRAYALCAELTRQHSKTFSLASSLLPRSKCQAARALYAFCRTSDDIVDLAHSEQASSPLGRLDEWREQALSDCEDEEDLLLLAWADTQTNYHIPRLYAEQLIDGVARDLNQTRYATFEELTSYCYGVASTVGLMSMHIIGYAGPEAIPYAVKLGVALQLTNILRDVAEDWSAGRLYLPQDELAAFDLTEADIDAGEVDDRWRAFMRFQIGRVRQIYAASLPGVALLHQDGRFAIGAAAELYLGILEDIEAHDMDVFSRRAYLSRNAKLRRLPGIWWRAKVRGYQEASEAATIGDRQGARP